MRFLPLLLFALLPAIAFAQEAAAAPTAKKLTVVVKAAPPFVIASSGEPTGLTIDLWDRIAQDLQLASEFKILPSVPQVIETLSKKEADAGLGAITMNSEREQVIDFTHPFYDSGLQILVPTQKSTSIFSTFKTVAGDLITVVIILLVALVTMAHLLWFFERRYNPESFPDNYPGGVIEAGWWAICTLITGGCENIAPRAVSGRLIAIVWMITGFGLVSFVTARMASIMTVNTLTSEVRSLADLRGAPVGTLAGTAAETFLKREPVLLRGFPDLEAAAQALLAGDVKAFIYDAPILRYYLAQHPEAKLQLVGAQFDKQKYGIALPPGSPLRKEINRVLLRLTEEGFLDQLDKKWFGEKGGDEGKAEK